MKDYYAILEVPPAASPEEIREQYLFLIQAWHPDKFRTAAQKARAEEKCKQINIAYGVLKDAEKRRLYDASLHPQPPHGREQVRPRKPPEASQPRRSEQPPARPAPPPRRPAEPPPPPRDPAEELRVQQEWIRVYFEQARRRDAGPPPTAPARPIRILVVDDRADARSHIRDLLRSEADIRIVGEAPNGSKAVEQFDALLPDVMLTGIDHPDLDAFVPAQTVLRKHPTSKVIVLSAQGSTAHIQQAAMLGACDYLTRPLRLDDLRSAIRLAAGPPRGS